MSFAWASIIISFYWGFLLFFNEFLFNRWLIILRLDFSSLFISLINFDIFFTGDTRLIISNEKLILGSVEFADFVEVFNLRFFLKRNDRVNSFEEIYKERGLNFDIFWSIVHLFSLIFKWSWGYYAFNIKFTKI
jgi:hypothetical protein